MKTTKSNYKSWVSATFKGWTYQYRKNRAFPKRYLCCFQPYSASLVWKHALNHHVLPLLLLCLLLPVALFLWSRFPVSMPPLFPVPPLSPSRISSLTFSFRSSLEACRSGTKLGWRVLFVEAGKATPSRFLLFCMKLAAGVAYLTRTEIPVVERQGVPLITSAATISFRLIEQMSRIRFGLRMLFPFLLFLKAKWTLVSHSHIYHRGWLVIFL